MKINFQNQLKFVSIALLSSLITSCGKNIPSVQNLEKMTTQLEKGAKNISADIYGSCLRTNKYASSVLVLDLPEKIDQKEREKNRINHQIQ